MVDQGTPGVDSVSSWTGAGSGVDSVISWNGAGSGVDSLSSWNGASSWGARAARTLGGAWVVWLLRDALEALSLGGAREALNWTEPAETKGSWTGAAETKVSWTDQFSGRREVLTLGGVLVAYGCSCGDSSTRFFHMRPLPYLESRWRRGWQPCCEFQENSFSYVLFVFLLFYVLDVVSITVYDRDTLLNIGSSVAQRKPDFEFFNAGGLFTDTASEPFVWVAKSTRHRRRRKRAGVLVRLRRRAFRPPLPIILLANVQSLDNKLCELRAHISYQRETRDCCVICLTETWMSAIVPDSAIELTGFSVHRSDRTKELTGKSRGGGVCFYINNSWCNERNIHSIKSFCSPDLEFHTLLCRPFWLPREFTAIIITAVYIPPQANTDQALKELYRNVQA